MRQSEIWRDVYAHVHDLKQRSVDPSQFWSPTLHRSVSVTTASQLILDSLSCTDTLASVHKKLVGSQLIDAETFGSTWEELSDCGFVFSCANVFERPLLIVSAPRAGSTLLFETMCMHSALWSVGGESHFIIESLPSLQPESRNYDSHRLETSDADTDTRRLLTARFVSYLREHTGRLYLDIPTARRPSRIRLLEKTPRNALRVGFLNVVFPDALFVFLHRDPYENIASIIEAWDSDGFWEFKRGVPYCELPGWEGEQWCMLLPPGWRELNGASTAEIATFQWQSSNEHILHDLVAEVPHHRWISVDYAELTADPAQTIRRICDFAGIPIDATLTETLSSPLRASSSTVSQPSPGKWRRHEAAIRGAMTNGVRELTCRLEALRDS